MAEVLRPPDLAPSKYFSRREVFQIFVVGDNVNGEVRAFEIVPPLGEGVEDGQELFIVSVVVEFRASESP